VTGTVLQGLQGACNRKKEIEQNDGSKTYSILYIGWLVFLSLLSSWVIQWDIHEVDWWPFACEDEVILMRPYLHKTQWRCVRTTVFVQILIVRNTLAWAEMIGVMLTSKASLRKVPRLTSISKPGTQPPTRTNRPPNLNNHSPPPP
jgi:hypothetical protein